MFINSLVLGTNTTGKTGKLLAKVLHGEYSTNDIPNSHNLHLIWRWGNFSTEIPRELHVNIINDHVNSIFRNKAETRKRLIMNNVSCPKIYTSETMDEAKFPLIARPVFHMRGRDFNIVNDIDTAMQFLRNGYYIQEIIETEKEYRIFMFNQKILECNIKELVRIPKRPLHPLIKNWKNGYIFKQVLMNTLSPNTITTCQLAQAHVGLSFCAIDCAVNKNGTAYIFELNSAPGLIERKAIKLCKRILHHLEYSDNDIKQTLDGNDYDENNSSLRIQNNYDRYLWMRRRE